MGNIGLEPELTREVLAKEYRKACARIAALVELNEGNIAEVSRLRADLESERAKANEWLTQLHDARNELMVARTELEEARKRVVNQRDRIRVLEGVTNHAGGLGAPKG